MYYATTSEQPSDSPRNVDIRKMQMEKLKAVIFFIFNIFIFTGRCDTPAPKHPSPRNSSPLVAYKSTSYPVWSY